MPRRGLTRLAEAVGTVALLILALVLLVLTPAAAQEPSGAQATSEDAIAPPVAAEAVTGELQLEVTINSIPAKKIESFVDQGGGHLAAERRALEEIGINPPGGGAADQLIALDDVPDLAYFYDAPAQRIDIVAGDRRRIRKTFDASASDAPRDAARADYGAVLNYSVLAAGSSDTNNLDVPAFNGVNTSLDGRLISPYGVLNQTGIIGQTATGEGDGAAMGALRLETTYTYADEEDLILYRAGDIISGGPDWSRPIRMGGLQAQRSFRLRPDLVTQSLPSFSGSAAVPSTVDVYVNNAKAYSKDVGAGPFQIDNMPSINGAGTARVVVRDAAGRETEQSLEFYGSPQLLRPGIWDFSAEAGVARHDYGLKSSDYEGDVVASGSFKTGVYDDVTVEGHAEGGKGLINVGAGVTLRAGIWGLATIAASVSNEGGETGYQLYGSAETKIGPVTVRGKSQRAFEDYQDLASISARGQRAAFPGTFVPGGLFSVEPPRAIDTIGFNVPIDLIDTNFSINFVHYEATDGDTSNLLTATVSRPLFANASMYASGYTDLDDRRTSAVYAGINMSLGDGYSLSSGASRRNDLSTASVEASKSLSREPGSVGWRVRDREGEDPYRSGDIAYRGESGLVTGSIRQDKNNVRGTIEVEGAVAAIDGDIYTANRIDDAFALVDVGAAGVKVMHQNNAIGETGEDGKILIPNLTSYQRNKLAIDPMGLPLDTEMTNTSMNVTPAYQSGVVAGFNVKQRVQGAIVILKDASGKDLPAGSAAALEGSSEVFVVGYDGETYVTGLKNENTITVDLGDRTCQAHFAFTPQPNSQPTIGPEVCQ
jgi:outer membrane usher protein